MSPLARLLRNQAAVQRMHGKIDQGIRQAALPIAVVVGAGLARQRLECCAKCSSANGVENSTEQ